MIWITKEQILKIHSRIIEATGGLDGVRDIDGLESALSSPMQSFDKIPLYPSELEKIARIGFGLASNHAFIDGNKRIGAMTVQLLLKWNGYNLKLKQGELSDMFISIAAGETKYDDLLLWIKEHIK